MSNVAFHQMTLAIAYSLRCLLVNNISNFDVIACTGRPQKSSSVRLSVCRWQICHTNDRTHQQRSSGSCCLLAMRDSLPGDHAAWPLGDTPSARDRQTRLHKNNYTVYSDRVVWPASQNALCIRLGYLCLFVYRRASLYALYFPANYSVLSLSYSTRQ